MAEVFYKETLEEEIEHLRLEGVWGTTTVLYPLATVIQTPIVLHMADTDPKFQGERTLNVLEVEPSIGNPQNWGEPIPLFHHHGAHYDRMMPLAVSPPGTRATEKALHSHWVTPQSITFAQEPPKKHYIYTGSLPKALHLDQSNTFYKSHRKTKK